MALEYENNSKFEKLAPIMEDYADWFGRIAVCVSYYDEEVHPENVMAPLSFQAWIEEDSTKQILNPLVIEDLTKSHDDMVQIGTGILDIVKTRKKPPRDSFEEFKHLYGAFISRIRRLEKDSAVAGSGIDEATGLRNPKTIEADLKKEMERLSRQGNPFSLVLTRIDRFAGQPDQNVALAISVSNIKRCMRSFDDAYYLGNGHFLLSLKHADIIGAQAAAGRLQQFLKEDENNEAKMTMSYCLAEPVPGDEIPELMKNMNDDLANNLNEQDVVLKFLEVSALERFVNKIEG